MATRINSGEPPLVSVCVPVYDTEPYLERCLRSAAEQDFDRFEIVVVSDASRGKDARGRNAKKIVKAVQKECGKARKLKGLPAVPFKFIESNQNRGILETRRTLLYEARGECVAFLDSDDEFLPGALAALYKAQVEYGADIVHGEFISGDYDASGVFKADAVTKCGAIYHGVLNKNQIARSWSAGAFNGNVIGKLFSRQLLLAAFEKIPYTECTMAEDFVKDTSEYKAAAIRAIQTVAQTAIATIGTTAMIQDVNWAMVGSTALLAGLLSVLTSIVTGLPEV